MKKEARVGHPPMKSFLLEVLSTRTPALANLYTRWPLRTASTSLAARRPLAMAPCTVA
jgi:hypothetical protein